MRPGRARQDVVLTTRKEWIFYLKALQGIYFYKTERKANVLLGKSTHIVHHSTKKQTSNI